MIRSIKEYKKLLENKNNKITFDNIKHALYHVIENINEVDENSILNKKAKFIHWWDKEYTIKQFLRDLKTYINDIYHDIEYTVEFDPYDKKIEPELNNIKTIKDLINFLNKYSKPKSKILILKGEIRELIYKHKDVFIIENEKSDLHYEPYVSYDYTTNILTIHDFLNKEHLKKSYDFLKNKYSKYYNISIEKNEIIIKEL